MQNLHKPLRKPKQNKLNKLKCLKDVYLEHNVIVGKCVCGNHFICSIHNDIYRCNRCIKANEAFKEAFDFNKETIVEELTEIILHILSERINFGETDIEDITKDT